MSTNNPVQESVADMLRVVTTAVDKMREEQSKAIQELKEERNELHKLSELHQEFTREYDRLTDRVSTQVKALILAIDEVKKNL